MHPIRGIAPFLKPYRTLAIFEPLWVILGVAVDLTLPYQIGRLNDAGS